MLEGVLKRCLRGLAAPAGPGSAAQQGGGRPLAPPPVGWILLDLLRLLPDTDPLRLRMRSDLSGLAAQLGAAERDPAALRAMAAPLFHQASTQAALGLVKYLAANPDALQLLNAILARSGSSGTAGCGSHSALAESLRPLVLPLWERFEDLQHPSSGSSPAAALRLLLGITQLQLAVQLQGRSAAASGRLLAATMAAHGRAISAALLDLQQRQFGRLGSQEQQELSWLLANWAQQSSSLLASLEEGEEVLCAAAAAACVALIPPYLSTALAALAATPGLSCSLLSSAGPLATTAPILHNLALAASRSAAVAHEAAAGLLGRHSSGLAQALVACLRGPQADLRRRAALAGRGSQGLKAELAAARSQLLDFVQVGEWLLGCPGRLWRRVLLAFHLCSFCMLVMADSDC